MCSIWQLILLIWFEKNFCMFFVRQKDDHHANKLLMKYSFDCCLYAQLIIHMNFNGMFNQLRNEQSKLILKSMRFNRWWRFDWCHRQYISAHIHILYLQMYIKFRKGTILFYVVAENGRLCTCTKHIYSEKLHFVCIHVDEMHCASEQRVFLIYFQFLSTLQTKWNTMRLRNVQDTSRKNYWKIFYNMCFIAIVWSCFIHRCWKEATLFWY